MSDHIDGPRQIGDPSADLTDLFAFTSPENPLGRYWRPMSFRLAALTRSSPMRSITRSSFGVPGWLASATPQIRDERPGGPLQLSI